MTAISFVDRVNNLAESYPDYAHQNDADWKDQFKEYGKKTWGNHDYLLISISAYLSQKLMDFVDFPQKRPVPFENIGKMLLAGIAFPLICVVGIVEFIARTILGCVTQPILWLASTCGAVEKKTHNFFHYIAFTGGSESGIVAIGALVESFSNLLIGTIALLDHCTPRTTAAEAP